MSNMFFLQVTRSQYLSSLRPALSSSFNSFATKACLALILAILLSLFFSFAQASAASAKVNVKQIEQKVKKGEKLYQQCVACHGDKGQGNDVLNAPRLAGQYAWYIQRQLKNFSQELRGKHNKDLPGLPMIAIAKNLTEVDVSALSVYISQLSGSTPYNNQSPPLGDMKNGSRYYQAKCGACHGGKAQGNKAFNAPKLAQQSDAYLQRQMNHFTQGIRGTAQIDKFGRQMAMMAKIVSAKELNDIMFYISKQ